MGSQYLPGAGGRMCKPVALSAEVKSYIDTKIASGSGALCAEIPKMVGRVAELEGRMGDLDKYRKMREEVEEKRQQLEQALSVQRNEQNDILSKVRVAEIDRLKLEASRVCAGITVKSVGAPVSAPRGAPVDDDEDEE